ncbi:hypothetical protein ACFQ0B_57730 [Nonomuraea thailandensis]
MYVKICGLSEPEHVATAVEAGADAIGFVLTRSPRRITPSGPPSWPRRCPGTCSPSASSAARPRRRSARRR